MTRKFKTLAMCASALCMMIASSISLPSLAAANPVTLRLAGPHFPITLDPQLADDSDSVDNLEPLFLGLTDIDPTLGTIRPSMATSWSQDKTGHIWTFTLRGDIPWVKWDAKNQKATAIRLVTAQDFVYAIKRSCDPRLNAFYMWVVAGLIDGCDKVVKLDKTKVKDSDLDQIAVRALSDSQLEVTTVTTKADLPYFLSTSDYWMFRAVPKEIIDQFGAKWTQADHILTNGPFALAQYTQNSQATYIRNPLFPSGVNSDPVGNIQRITYTNTGNTVPIRSYFNSLIDMVEIPLASAQNVLANLDNFRQDPTEVVNFISRPVPIVYYFGFMYDKPPFDKVAVRRAVSAAIDRSGFADQFGGQAIGHFTPPGMYGGYERGNPEAEVGDSGYDSQYAADQLSAAGFPDCKGLPMITVETTEAEPVAYLKQMMQESLGCSAGRIISRVVDPEQLLADIKPGAKNRPQAFLLGWAPDYPDANNWVHDVLSCHTENDLQRPCNAIDDQIDQASAMPLGIDRISQYHAIEKAFFGQDGEFPIAPLAVYYPLSIVKPWLHGPINSDGRFGAYHWETYTLDQAAQSAGENYHSCGCG